MASKLVKKSFSVCIICGWFAVELEALSRHPEVDMIVLHQNMTVQMKYCTGVLQI